MKILSPAKINLFLQVTGKRPDGNHELFSLMCCVSLFDTIYLDFGGKKIEIESSHPHIPLDETNLAHKAAALFLKYMGVYSGVKITIEKSIPVAAGLGGGSSNAASVLTGLNRHYEYPFSRERLMSMGFSLGADVPFLLFQQPALVTGIGEKLEAYPDPLPYHVILVYPGFRVSTAEVFQNLNLRLTKCKKKFTRASLKKTGYNISLHACNDLEAVTAARYPVIKSVKQQLLKQGASGVLMSGSGPTIFGLFTDQNKADKAMQAIGRHSRWNAYPVEIIN
ncbi:MAG: 4-(cytidine 5'-diphospho)-2-C-methyl-D-erythritol kinase [Deltaproteobacteria bacterium]|nr:4-(cytidine 5'-diphospho)-2-C-methyl-D-erythritol kinase [Deltaproteobacteria bacterium]